MPTGNYPYNDFPFQDYPYQDFPFSGYPHASHQPIKRDKPNYPTNPGFISLIILPFALIWFVIRIIFCLFLLLCKDSRKEKNIRQ